MTNSRLFTRARGLLVLGALSLAAALPALRSAEAVPNYERHLERGDRDQSGHLRSVVPLPDPHHQRQRHQRG